MIARPKAQYQPPSGWRDDWADTVTRNAVLDLSMSKIGVRSQIDVAARADLPHARTLRLEGAHRALTITLDQGFGFWQPSRRVPFDFGVSSQAQAVAMSRAAFDVRGEGGQATLIFLQGGSLGAQSK